MKSLAVISSVALIALSTSAFAGGYSNYNSYSNRQASFLSPSIGVSLGNIGVLNGLLGGGVGNNSSILSGILSGNNGLLNVLGGSSQSNGNGNGSHNGNGNTNNSHNGNYSHNGNGSHHRR